MSDCIFCKIINKQIPGTLVYDTKDCIVINDIHPQAPVHLLVVPKTHYSEFLVMPEDVLSRLLELSKNVIREQNISSYRLVNNGKGAALIDHFHLHILGKIDKNRGL
jgi:histidine triad (HIT) family protein